MASRQARYLLPKSATNDAAPVPVHAPPRRKREAVPTACDRCRQRKVRCDGKRPYCHNCQRAGLGCKYSEPKKSTPKQKTMIAEDQRLHDVVRELRSMGEPEVVNLLGSIRAVPTAKEALELVQTITSGHTDASLPRAGRSASNTAFAPEEASGSSRTDRIDSETAIQTRLPISLWTSISKDEEVLMYLYTLFWTWDNTLTKIIHEAMLVEDLRTGLGGVATLKEAGHIEFCSEFLINSILALSTIYSLQSDPCIGPTGRVFADEAFRLLEIEEPKPSLPFMQGTAILAVYKLSVGETATATYLLEILRRLPSPMEWLAACPLPKTNTASLRAQDTRTAIACISWGFYCLDAKLGLLLDRQMVLRKPLLAAGLSDGADSHRMLWFPHPLLSPSCFSYSAEAFAADCAFAELAREALVQISANRACLVPDYSSTKDLSYRMIKAKVSMGEMVKGDSHHLPRRIFLFLSYYTTSIRLLEPFVQLSFLDFEGGQTAASLSLVNSNAIVSTLWNYRAAFGMRHEYWMLYACQVAAMAMLVHPQSMCLQGESFVRVCQLLTSIAKRLPMADLGVSVLLRYISLKEIDIPDEARQLLDAGRSHTPIGDGIRMMNATAN